jgi:hypothetical protein
MGIETRLDSRNDNILNEQDGIVTVRSFITEPG